MIDHVVCICLIWKNTLTFQAMVRFSRFLNPNDELRRIVSEVTWGRGRGRVKGGGGGGQEVEKARGMPSDSGTRPIATPWPFKISNSPLKRRIGNQIGRHSVFSIRTTLVASVGIRDVCWSTIYCEKLLPSQNSYPILDSQTEGLIVPLKTDQLG